MGGNAGPSGRPPRPPLSSSPSGCRDGGGDLRQWRLTFSGMVKIITSQKLEIETLAEDKKFLEAFARAQEDRWATIANMLLSRLEEVSLEEEKTKHLHESKMVLHLAMKDLELQRYKKLAELADDDIADFLACIKALTAEVSKLGILNESGTQSDTSDSSKDEKHNLATLKGELRKARQVYKDFKAEKDSQVAALLSEKDFAWDQFKRMENDYTALLRTKRLEASQANEAAEKLQRMLEDRQQLILEKDEKIERIQAECSQFEIDLRRTTEELKEAKDKAELLQRELDELHSNNKQEDARKSEATAKSFKQTARKPNLKAQPITSTSSASKKVARRKGVVESSTGRTSGSSEDDTGQKRKRSSRLSSRQQSASTSGPTSCTMRAKTRGASPAVSPLFSSALRFPKLKESAATKS